MSYTQMSWKEIEETLNKIEYNPNPEWIIYGGPKLQKVWDKAVADYLETIMK
jgi:hypothetical protein